MVSLAVGEMWNGIARKNSILSLNFTVGFDSFMVELMALQMTAWLASLAEWNYQVYSSTDGLHVW